MRTSVGINETVNTEVAVVGHITKVTAVGVARLTVSTGFERNRVIGKFPDTAAEELIGCPDQIPVFAQIAGAVTHCMAVFAHEVGLCVVALFKAFFQNMNAGIHITADIDCREVFVVFLDFAVVNQTGIILRTEIIAHRDMVLTPAGFVAERPEDDGRMVLIALIHQACTVNICFLPVGMLGQETPVVVDLTAVCFDVCLVTDKQTVFIAQLIEARIVRIVRGTDHVDVVTLHDHQIFTDMFERRCMTENRMAVVTVDTAALDLLTVDVNDLILDLNLADTDIDRDIFVASMQHDAIQIRCFVAPKLGIVDMEGDDRVAVSICFDSTLTDFTAAAADCLPVNSQRAVCGDSDLDISCREIVSDVLGDLEVHDVCLVTVQKVYFTEDTGHSPHILVFQIRTVAPLEDEYADVVCTGIQELGNRKFAGHMRNLAVADEIAVDVQIEAGIHTFKVEIDFLFFQHRCFYRKGTLIQRTGIFIGDVRCILGIRIVDVGIVGNIIACTQLSLPVHRNGHRVGKFDTASPEGFNFGFIVIELEIPFAAQGLEIGGHTAFPMLCFACIFKRNIIRARCFGTDVQRMRIFMIMRQLCHILLPHPGQAVGDSFLCVSEKQAAASRIGSQQPANFLIESDNGFTIVAVVHRSAEIVGSRPLDTIVQDLLNIFVVEGTACFMTGLEVEDLTASAMIGTAGTEDVTVFKPGDEQKLIGLGNHKGFAVHFLGTEIDIFGNTCGDRMRRENIPQNFVLIVTPQQLTGCTDDLTERLGHMRGVHCDKAHTVVINALLDSLNQRIINIAVCHMTPPHEDIGVVQNIIRQTLIGIVKSRETYFQIIMLIEEILNTAMDTLGVNFTDEFLGFFVSVFVPDRYANFICHCIYLSFPYFKIRKFLLLILCHIPSAKSSAFLKITNFYTDCRTVTP